MRSNIAYSEERYNMKQIKLMENTERENKKYMILQKLLGIVSVLVGIAELVAGYNGLIDEGGIFLIMLPLGIYLATTKTQVL